MKKNTKKDTKKSTNKNTKNTNNAVQAVETVTKRSFVLDDVDTTKEAWFPTRPITLAEYRTLTETEKKNLIWAKTAPAQQIYDEKGFVRYSNGLNTFGVKDGVITRGPKQGRGSNDKNLSRVRFCERKPAEGNSPVRQKEMEFNDKRGVHTENRPAQAKKAKVKGKKK